MALSHFDWSRLIAWTLLDHARENFVWELHNDRWAIIDCLLYLHTTRHLNGHKNNARRRGTHRDRRRGWTSSPSVTSHPSSFSMPTSKLMPHRLDISADGGVICIFGATVERLCIIIWVDTAADRYANGHTTIMLFWWYSQNYSQFVQWCSENPRHCHWRVTYACTRTSKCGNGAP